MKRRYALFGMTALLAVALAVPALGGPGNPVADTFASAKSTAKKALKKAKEANKAAKAAQSTADDAQNSADGAQNSADAAQAAADTAQTTADNASTAAAAAQTTADSKFGTTDAVFGTTSPSDSNATKLVVADCPGSSSPTGGGFALAGAGSNDVTATINTVYLGGWIAQAQEIGAGTASNWSMQANVTCISP